MGRGWRPIVVGGAIAVTTFALAQAKVFAPSQAEGGASAGDQYRGETIFQRDCAGCHGDAGVGGVGPALAGSGLAADDIAAAVQQGRGIMPAGIVTGQEQADAVAYVVSIAGAVE